MIEETPVSDRRGLGDGRRRAERDLQASERLFRLLAEHAEDIVYRYRLLPEPGFDYVSPAATAITGYTPEEHYANPDLGFELVHPDDRHLLVGIAEGALLGASLTLRWVRRDGRVIWTEQRNVAVRDDRTGQLVAIEGIARDVTARKRAEDQLVALAEVTRASLEQRPADEVLALIARRARELAVGSTAAVTVPVGDRDVLYVRVADGEGAEALAGVTVPSAGTLSAAVMQSRRSLRLDDAPAEAGVRPLPPVGAVGPLLVVPLAAGSSVFGTLSIVRHPGQPVFDDDDTEVVEIFAERAAAVLEHARLQDQVQHLAILRDRERIARDLHDGVIQSLFGIGTVLQVAERMDGGEDLIRGRINDAMLEIDRVIKDVRNYVYALRPTLLQQSTVQQALERLVADMGARHGVPASLQCEDGCGELLAPVAIEVVHMVREALANVARHANAAHCRVAARRVDHSVQIEVEDDGRGFDAASVPRGHGLSNLHERAVAIGGSLDVDTAPGHGTTLRITVPLVVLAGETIPGA